MLPRDSFVQTHGIEEFRYACSNNSSPFPKIILWQLWLSIWSKCLMLLQILLPNTAADQILFYFILVHLSPTKRARTAPIRLADAYFWLSWTWLERLAGLANDFLDSTVVELLVGGGLYWFATHLDPDLAPPGWAGLTMLSPLLFCIWVWLVNVSLIIIVNPKTFFS